MLISSPNLVSYFMIQYNFEKKVKTSIFFLIKYTLQMKMSLTKSNEVEFSVVMIALPRSNINFMRQTSLLKNVIYL